MTAQSRAVLVVEIEIESGYVEEFNRWYDEEHIPQRMTYPGFISARRFRSADSETRFLAIYELESAEAATSKEYMSRPPTEWTEQIMPHWVNWSRHVWNALEST